MPLPLVRRAFDEAITWSKGWVGPEHLLLALVARTSVATEVLATRNLNYDALSQAVELPLTPENRYDPARGLSGPNPDGQR